MIMIKRYYNIIGDYYTEFIKSKTAKSYGIILSGNLLTGFLGMVSSILIARFLGPGSFGLFSTVIAVQLVVGSVVDFGFTKGFVTLLSNKSYEKFHPEIYATGFYLRILFCVFAVLLGILTADYVSTDIFEDKQLILPLKIGYLVMFFGGMWGILQLKHQAFQQFKVFAASRVISAITKFVVILILFYFTIIDINTALIAFLISFFIGACYSLIYINKKYFSISRFRLKIVKLLLKINQWIVYVNLFYILSGRVSIFMLSSMAGAFNVGIYNAAFSLINGMALVLESISTVLLPEVSNIDSPERLKKFLLKSFSISIPLVLCCVVGIFLAKPTILIIYGMEYIESTMVLIPLLVWFMVCLIVEPMIMLSYGISRPDIVFYSTLVNFILIISLNLYLIPLFGPKGAAYSLIISRVISSFINIFWNFSIIKSRIKDGSLAQVSLFLPE